MNILQMSISAAILVVTIVIIRSLTIHKLPKKTFVMLWAVVLLRLLIPFSIPLPFNVYPVADKAIEFFTAIPAAVQDTQTAIPNSPSVDLPPNISIDDIHPPVAQVTQNSVAQIPPVVVVWLAGMILCALFFLVTHLHCRREYKTALPLENDTVGEWLKNQKLKRPIQIRYSDRINAPMTYGIWKPVILFPKTTDWRDEPRLRYILTHELTHIRHFDVLLKGLFAATVCIHWFNPLAWVMYILANRDIEMSCDETVVWTFGGTMKSAYALALIGLEERKSGFAPLCNHFAKNAIEERISAIMKTKRTTLVSMLLALMSVTGAIAIVCATSAVAAQNDPLPNNTVQDTPAQNNDSQDSLTQINDTQDIPTRNDNEQDLSALDIDELSNSNNYSTLKVFQLKRDGEVVEIVIFGKDFEGSEQIYDIAYQASSKR